MPDRRSHRGPHPEDEKLFSAQMVPVLREAVSDLSWLLSRGYSLDGSLKLVGDRYRLVRRQRLSVGRCAASDDAVAARAESHIEASAGHGSDLLIDGYNLLTTMEAALGGGVILLGRDGTYRDMASMHGTYRKVSETIPALTLIGASIAHLDVHEARWLLDSPVSNSGRLASVLRDLAKEQGWTWRVELVQNPDAVLKHATAEIVVSADSVVIDSAPRWLNLARHITDQHIPDAWVIDLATRCDDPH